MQDAVIQVMLSRYGHPINRDLSKLMHELFNEEISADLLLLETARRTDSESSISLQANAKSTLSQDTILEKLKADEQSTVALDRDNLEEERRKKDG